MHSSVKLESPVEFINLTPLNPLISKCEIKVCYVGDSPNRNGSIITKDTAKKMANSLPGSPIVGFFNEEQGDFEEHNKIIDISNGKFEIKDTTKPYGFVDLNAKVWFQKFLDDGITEHEYLMTEGYLWTGQYPECQRILDRGNNQSMNIDNEFIQGNWTKDTNGRPQFFIINEAVFSNLCILGEDVEPCFEGSSIAKVEFSFEDGFKQKFASMINELKTILKEGGAKVNSYSVSIGDELWDSFWASLENNYADQGLQINGFYEEEEQKYAVLFNAAENKYYRCDFSLADDEHEFSISSDLKELEGEFEPQFDAAEIFAYAEKNSKNQDKLDKEEPLENEDNVEGKASGESEEQSQEQEVEEPATEEHQEPEAEDQLEPAEEPAVQYNLDDIPEYVELMTKYSALSADYEELKARASSLEEEIKPLTEFKKKAEKKEKQDMIDSFYMLSDSDKDEVIKNIDTYSLDDIEAKLSIMCVRNKVSFDLEDDEEKKKDENLTFNLNEVEDSATPQWVKAVLAHNK